MPITTGEPDVPLLDKVAIGKQNIPVDHFHEPSEGCRSYATASQVGKAIDSVYWGTAKWVRLEAHSAAIIHALRHPRCPEEDIWRNYRKKCRDPHRHIVES